MPGKIFRLSAPQKYLSAAIITLPLSMLLSSFFFLLLFFSGKKLSPEQISNFSNFQKKVILLFFIYTLLEIFWVFKPLNHVLGFLGHYVLYTLLFFLLAKENQNSEENKFLLLLAILSGTLLAIIGIIFFAGLNLDYQYLKIPGLENEYLFRLQVKPWENGELRKERLPMHANIMSAYLLMSILLTLGVYQEKKLRIISQNYFYYLFLLLQIICLIIASSKTAYISFLITLCLFFFSTKKKFSLLLLICFFVLSFWLFPEQYRLIGQSLENFFTVSTNAERLETWRIVWKIIGDYPQGSGILNYETVYAFYRENYFLAHAHNLFLQIFLESGLIGGFLFFIFFTSLIFSQFRNPKVPFFIPLSILSFFLCNLTDYFLAEPRITTFLTFLIFIGQNFAQEK